MVGGEGAPVGVEAVVEHGRDAVHRQLDDGLDRRAAAQRRARVVHRRRIGDERERPGVGDVEVSQGFADTEGHPGAVERLVRRHLGAGVGEAEAAVGEEQADGDLAPSLVGPVRDPQEAAEARHRVVEVHVHGLVEVGLGPNRVGVVVLGAHGVLSASRVSVQRPSRRSAPSSRCSTESCSECRSRAPCSPMLPERRRTRTPAAGSRPSSG